MSDTSASLLTRLREHPDPDSWRRLVDLYTPLVSGWFRRYSVAQNDIHDLVQEVLTVLVREIPRFHYDPGRGSFRGWLRSITLNRLRAYWRQRRSQPEATGNSELARLLEQLEDHKGGLSRLWDKEHDEHLARRVLEDIAPEFEGATFQAFRRVVIDGQAVAKVAGDLGVSLNAVYVAKCRVLRRLRQELRGIVE
jgi:RNA polymerase sigma-70 factor (ECF subfamily)